MFLPCPACGFVTVDEEAYGTHNICEICKWEDDAVQLANPACGGGANATSLIDAQRVVLVAHPLTTTIANGIERDAKWRPLNPIECHWAESQKQIQVWLNPASYNPERVYWRVSKPTFVIDGNAFSTLDEFYDVITHSLIPGAPWGRNLDALNDIFRGGFGTPENGFRIRWLHSRLSKERLGYPETIRQLQRQLKTCHPANVEQIHKQLVLAESQQGPTVYDWLLEIIGVHCWGGSESQDGIELSLE